MQVEVTESWLEAAGAIGTLLAVSIGAFVQRYSKSREDERTSAEASPAIVRHGVGAALVDRAMSDDVAQIREDVSELRRIAAEREQREDVREVVRDELRKRQD